MGGSFHGYVSLPEGSCRSLKGLGFQHVLGTSVHGIPLASARLPTGSHRAGAAPGNFGDAEPPGAQAWDPGYLVAHRGVPKNQWEFQDPKLEVPTIYKAYIRPM